MVDDDETLLYQLEEDIYNLLSPEYPDIVVKSSYEDFPAIHYPCVLIYEIENSAVSQFYDLQEHIINVTYQFNILCDQTETRTANENVRHITTLIRDYMRGERYHALKRLGNTPIVKKQDDENIRIGYMRYVGRIDIDTNTIYRRN
jgi:hypothetical protein